MANRISFKNGTGVLAEPAGEGKAPALVVLQEWWGLDDHIESLVDRFAKEGFLVVAPDLYHGKTTKDGAEAAKLMGALDTLKAVDEIAGAVAFLKDHPRSNGKVGVTGFCLGGALTLASACHVPAIAAAVPFYGIPPAEKVDYAKVTAPISMHVAKKDEWVTVGRAEEVKQKVEALAKTPFELHVYDADHAFMNDTRPAVYAAAEAKIAWDRAVAFLQRHLA
ncbi:MAG: dienelactone hydrolase family protein [Labilithrix sp.]|nr:dienelactone hydrolase family protein [Labilithrix sp.]MCW5814573.1 dienelactone hydrolase family protein [Labilithrix sp.]